MTFEQFKQVLEVSKTGSINQAASNLFLSQAAVSTSIKNLEEELGQAIFLRNNRGIQPTAFGRDFISYITPICSQMTQLENIIQHPASDSHESFSVSGNGYRFISPICARLYQKYRPLGIHIYHMDGVGDETIDLVANHQVEIGIIRIWSCYKQIYVRQFFSRKLQFTPLATTKISIMVGKGSPLYDLNQDSITAGMLSDYPMVLHANLHNGPYSDIFARIGIPANKNRIIAGSRAIIYDTLDNTDAFYVSSDCRAAYEGTETPKYLRSFILDGCSINSEIGWLRHEDYILTPIAKEFIHEVTWMFQR